MDDDGHGATDLYIRCTLTIQDDHATVDFRASDDETVGPVNAVRAIVLSAVNYAFQCLAPAEIPSNEGVMRPMTVLTRPGSLVIIVSDFIGLSRLTQAYLAGIARHNEVLAVFVNDPLERRLPPPGRYRPISRSTPVPSGQPPTRTCCPSWPTTPPGAF